MMMLMEGALFMLCPRCVSSGGITKIIQLGSFSLYAKCVTIDTLIGKEMLRDI